SCFPKDVAALIRTAREASAPLSLIEQVDKVNSERKIAMVKRVEDAVGGELRGKTIAVLGVTFKPNTDDMRDAPSLVLIPMLLARGAIVRAYDPQGQKNAQELLEGVDWRDSALDAGMGADATVVLTEWNEFRGLDLGALKQKMRGAALIDLRNVYSAKMVQDAGLKYTSIGR
ncbi:MAG TPA: UDP-glucose/GDP-mannose dehydrogenase family protein, partial [Rhizobiales bacterium]|nr:UDP-glucose/GDP-mannose dehydrogenase family protein [Hyphomicrobiales bacterium]